MSWARHLPVRGSMTAPRQVLRNASYLVTRRCAQRQLLLRPSRATNDTFLFVLALAAGRYGVQVHAFCVLSNHVHLIVTDPHARLPAFLQLLDALVARAMNALLGRWESFWAPDTYSAVKLETPDDVVDKTAYVLANPVAAGLVAAGSAWPGLWSAPEAIGGEPLLARRPKHFFAPKGGLPDAIALPLAVPPGFESAEAFRGGVLRALEAREEEERSRRRGRGGFLGVRGVLRQNPTARPSPREPRRALNPRVAARDKWKRIEALGRLVDFLDSYRSAWAARCAGEPDAVFPCGTYLMRVVHGAPCAEFG